MSRNKKKIIRACTVSMSCVFFEDVMRRLRADGYEMVALTSPGPELDALKEEGFHCIELPMERHISPWNDLKALVKMVRVLRKEKPYMVHSMTPKAGLLCMMAGWLTRVPVRVHTFTGLVWPTSVGLKRKILMLTDKILCTCATHIIPEGQGVMDDLRSGGITKKPMKVLGYGNVKGVDMEVFNPERFTASPKSSPEGKDFQFPSPLGEGLGERLFTFLFVGRIVGDKGVNELVEAFTLLHEKYQQARLVLVGRYEENLDPVKQVTLDRIKANPAIEAVGPKYGDDLIAEYMKADCHILPSYREGFPNTPMEAGALGLPNIVTDINGAREIVVCLTPNPSPKGEGSIKICDNGIIVPPRTVPPLYEAMERMVTDAEMRERMVRNARPMIESRFEKGFVQECLIEYYKEILQP